MADRSGCKVVRITRGRTQRGKSITVEYRSLDGPDEGAEVNTDGPLPGGKGPPYPHVGHQSAGKRKRGAGVRRHMGLHQVPAGRSGL
jgi:hypothetical protein